VKIKHTLYPVKRETIVFFYCNFVSLFAWGLTALSAQIGYIAP